MSGPEGETLEERERLRSVQLEKKYVDGSKESYDEWLIRTQKEEEAARRKAFNDFVAHRLQRDMKGD